MGIRSKYGGESLGKSRANKGAKKFVNYVNRMGESGANIGGNQGQNRGRKQRQIAPEIIFIIGGNTRNPPIQGLNNKPGQRDQHSQTRPGPKFLTTNENFTPRG